MVEAMVAGVPVIATNVGGAPEIIREGSNGWLIDPKNGDDLLAKLCIVTALPVSAREQIAAVAKQDALRDFGPAEYLQHLEDYFITLRA
jgi:glycosyltransferase involved in cell wall biosynthesis